MGSLPEPLTLYLNRMSDGDAEARRVVLEETYPTLLDIARRVDWRAASPGQTQAMELLSEAVVRLSALRREWKDRDHFFATFAHAVRTARIDAFRRRERRAESTLPHGDDGTVACEEDGLRYDVLDLEEALGRLEGESAIAARIVTMRFYLGMTLEKIAQDLGIPLIRSRRLWQFSKNRLQSLLRGTR